MQEIDAGILSQCYNPNPTCESRSVKKILHGEHKGKKVSICLEGCSKEENDCPLIKGEV